MPQVGALLPSHLFSETSGLFWVWPEIGNRNASMPLEVVSGDSCYWMDTRNSRGSGETKFCLFSELSLSVSQLRFGPNPETRKHTKRI
jgi:hypothetical protein